MPPSIDRPRQEAVRAEISIGELADRLTDHALGRVELTATQLRAIEILLKKSLPDLQTTTLDGDADETVTIRGALTWQPPQ